MRNNFKRIFIGIFFISFFYNSLFAQFNPSTIPANELLKGYVKDISGENISYHSFHPYATEALLTRVTDGNKAIEWQTENIPQDYKDSIIYFAWIAGYSCGTSAADRHFDFYINNKKVLTFTTIAKKVIKAWNVKGSNGTQLFFDQKSVDNAGDVYGNMYLKIPAATYKKGEPLLLKVIGEKANSQDWYMTFKYEMSEKIKIIPQPALVQNGKDTLQLIDVQIDHTKPSGSAIITSDVDKNTISKSLSLGVNTIELLVPKVNSDKSIKVSVSVEGLLSKNETIELKPVVFREFDFVSHSHNDIGYSDLQDTVEQKQIRNIRDAIQLIRKTSQYPAAAKYKWNIESLWAVENFMKIAGEEEKKNFVDDVKSGSIGLPASYANELTGICSPEDLIHYTDYAFQLNRLYGIHFNTVMISDIPGVSWAMVPALVQRGIKYISSGPNYVPSIPELGDRVGYSDRAWGDKPFYWLSPSGKEKVLFWQAAKGYSWFHNFNVGRAGEKTKSNLMEYLKELDSAKYPYQMVQLRYTIPADNGTTDSHLSDFVKDWNKKYISPKIVLVNVSEMMEKFDKKYHNIIPVYSGDYSPYWEDGAASTAKELAITRHTGNRLNQSEILSTMLHPNKFDKEQFYKAWRDVVMFEEHTWGSWNSISDPDNPFTVSQWNFKKAFATDGEKRSQKIMEDILSSQSKDHSVYEVYNTSSWNRTDLVFLPKEQSIDLMNGVMDSDNRICPSQILSDGSMVFLAQNVPALGSKKYRLINKIASDKSDLKINQNVLENEYLKVTLNPTNGSIQSIIRKDNNQELVDNKQSGVNQYFYVPGRDPSKALSTKNVSIRIKEKGPLIVSLLVESEAPGTKKLAQEIRLIKGINRIDIINTIDKLKVREKEAVNFAFPFNMPDGKMKIDLGVGILQPEINQLDGSCKDFNCVQRWVDISNNKSGITWTTTDAPLIEIGALINEELVNGYKQWKKKTTLSNTFYSYVMNNYWHTNFKADQEGEVTFRYSIFPHNRFNESEATKRGIETNQPLIVSAEDENSAELKSLFTIENKSIILSTIKPSVDEKGIMLRLYNSSSESQKPGLIWNKLQPKKVYWSNANQEKLQQFNPDESWPPFTFKTLYLER
ncbi:MAG TPA: glycoside hydrolase family 38 C-terminal domain-containing protein [Hanamia sp.]|nr:glycoside hydrolase family 38 C-terminal domain-containing protein [Hanamia sp.]